MEALRHIKNKGSAVTIPVYTDCLSLLQALSWFRTTDPRIRELKDTVGSASIFTGLTCFRKWSVRAAQFAKELDHYLIDCPLTRQFATQIQPRAVYYQKGHAYLLRYAKNRALIIKLVRLVGDSIPDLS
ncbi:hypothetical protein MRX96_037494 [Rhipicephalus microplus]